MIAVQHPRGLCKDCRVGVNAEMLVIIDAHELGGSILVEKRCVIKILKPFLASFVFVGFRLYGFFSCVNCFFLNF